MRIDQRTCALAAGMALLALSGCATTPYEGKYAWSEGWRKAEAVAVQTAGEMRRPSFHTCVRNASPEQISTTKFAIVKYRQVSRTHTRAVPLQPADQVAPGQAVYVKVDDCTTPIAAASSKPNP